MNMPSLMGSFLTVLFFIALIGVRDCLKIFRQTKAPCLLGVLSRRWLLKAPCLLGVLSRRWPLKAPCLPLFQPYFFKS
jgi:hypothetical protein